MFGRKKIAMIVGEFFGTAVLTMIVLAVAKSNVGYPYFIGLAAGLAVTIMVMVVGQTSGAHLNPAITFALWTARKVSTAKAIVYIAAQLLGGISAYWLFTYFVGQGWHNSGHYEPKFLVAEAVGALVFGFGVAAAVYQKYEGGRLATTVGFSLTLGILIATTAVIAQGQGGQDAGLLNPAVALGTRNWVWGTYVLGPVIGAVIGVNLYNLLFATDAQLIGAKASVPKAFAKLKKPSTQTTEKKK